MALLSFADSVPDLYGSVLFLEAGSGIRDLSEKLDPDPHLSQN
jgi:hypothetical protein